MISLLANIRFDINIDNDLIARDVKLSMCPFRGSFNINSFLFFVNVNQKYLTIKGVNCLFLRVDSIRFICIYIYLLISPISYPISNRSVCKYGEKSVGTLNFNLFFAPNQMVWMIGLVFFERLVALRLSITLTNFFSISYFFVCSTLCTLPVLISNLG